MSTNAAVVLNVRGRRQRYFHHWDGYPSNMFPMLDFTCGHVRVREDDSFEDIESRFWHTWNLHERSLRAGNLTVDDLEKCRTHVSKMFQEGEDDQRMDSEMHGVDRNALVRIADGEEMWNEFKIEWTYFATTGRYSKRRLSIDLREGYPDKEEWPSA